MQATEDISERSICDPVTVAVRIKQSMWLINTLGFILHGVAFFSPSKRDIHGIMLFWVITQVIVFKIYKESQGPDHILIPDPSKSQLFE